MKADPVRAGGIDLFEYLETNMSKVDRIEQMRYALSSFTQRAYGEHSAISGAAAAATAAALETEDRPECQAHRRILNAILLVLRAGAPWRKAGIWDRILAALQEIADAHGQIDRTKNASLMAGSSERIRMRRALKGAPDKEAMGRSKGGFSTWVRFRT